MINVVSKPYLSLLVLVELCKPLLLSELYVPRAGNRQKDFTELVNMQSQGLSNKNCLNILKGEDPRKKGRPSIGSGNRRAEIPQQKTRVWQSKKRVANVVGADKQRDNKITKNLGQETWAGIWQANKTVRDPEQEIRAGIQQNNKIVGDQG